MAFPVAWLAIQQPLADAMLLVIQQTVVQSRSNSQNGATGNQEAAHGNAEATATVKQKKAAASGEFQSIYDVLGVTKTIFCKFQ